jgi:hypothetical protein
MKIRRRPDSGALTPVIDGATETLNWTGAAAYDNAAVHETNPTRKYKDSNL